MRYAQGGGLTAEGRRRREQVRLEAVKGFEQRVPAAVIAVGLRVSERSVRRWRQAWQAGGPTGVASRGQAARCRLDEELGARRAIERDDGAIEVWKKETWPRIKVRPRPSAAGSSSKTSAASR